MSMLRRLWPAPMMVAVGFLMLLLTSLEGWGMVAVIAVGEAGHADLLHELKRLHNLGLTGGFLAVCSGLALILLPPTAARCMLICRVLLPSFVIAPIAFGDRVLIVFAGPISFPIQGCFYALQAASALGITLGLGLMVLSLIRRER